MKEQEKIREGLLSELDQLRLRVAELEAAQVEGLRQEEPPESHQEELQMRVQERTAALLEAKQALQAEIAELKQAEEALRLTQFSVDRVADAIFWMGPDARFVYVNDTACRVLGYSRDEFLSMTMHDIDPWFPREIWPQHWEEVRRRGSFSLESRHRAKDGTVFPVEITVNHLVFGDKEFNCAFARDLTEPKQTQETLQLLESGIWHATDSIVITTVSRTTAPTIIYANPAFSEMTGYSVEEVIGKTTQILQGPKTDRSELRRMPQHILQGQVYNGQLTSYRKDGTAFCMEMHIAPVSNEAGEITHFVSVLRDITEQKQAEQALKESEEKYRQLFELGSDAYFLIDNESGRILDLNSAAIEMYGYSREEALQMKNTDFSAEPDQTQKATVEGATWIPVRYHRRKDGTVIPTEISGRHFPWRGREVHLAAIRDVTERLRVENQLRTSLREKEILLREIHHRVKNNLQIISALLNLQSQYTQDPHLRQAFQESQHRVRSMARIHEHLYKTQDLSRVDMACYINDLMTYLRHSHGAYAIAFDIDATDVTLTIELAIPCGLIINELVSNAIKYAFPGRQEGQIHVRLAADGDQLRLTVSDDGIGLPADLDLQNPPSLGLKLINVLSEQIDGTLRVDSSAGTTYEITFAA